MTTEDIVIGTEVANGKCVFIMRFLDRKGNKVAYFITFKKDLYFLHESSTRGVLFYTKYFSNIMQEVILEIFNRIKPQIKLKHASN